VNRIQTEDGAALRLAVDRRGDERGVEPNNMVPTATLMAESQPEFSYTPNWWRGFAGHIPMLARSRYKMSFRYRTFWQRGEGGANCYLYLNVSFGGPITESWHQSVERIGGLRENLHFGDGEWQSKELAFAAAEGVERCSIAFGMATWMAQSHYVWVIIDDVRLYPLNPEIGNLSFEKPASVPELVITREQVRELFGDNPARMLIHYPGDTAPPRGGAFGPIYYVDLHEDPLELKVLVEAVEGRLDRDPFISPDGTRVVYATADGIYVVRITPGGAGNTRIVETEEGYDPRWWVHPVTGDEFIIYVNTPVDTEDSIDGTTYLQQVERGGCQPVGIPKILIAQYAFRGGRSPCGRCTCTALPGRAFAELKPHAVEDAFVEIIYSDRRMCNPSISQDPAHPTRWLWLNEAHSMIHEQFCPQDVSHVHHICQLVSRVCGVAISALISK